MMLSRIACRAALQSQSLVPRPMVVGVQMASSAPANESSPVPSKTQPIEDPIDKVPRQYPLKTEGPERDLVNFPRPQLKEHPDPVRLGVVPEEWFDFFYKKTGVSGPYMFGIGTLTYLLSKEIYVLEHNFYNGLSIVIIVALLHKNFGPQLAAWADKGIEQWTKETRDAEAAEKVSLQSEIKDIETYNWKLNVYKELMDARRETAAAALEVTYREWAQNAYQEAKRRLDYQLELANVERRISQKNMASWITDGVLKSITPAQEQESLKKCIQDLKALSAAA